VLSFLQSTDRFTPLQKRDLTSAVQRVIDWIGLPAEAIPTSLPWLGKALLDRDPAVFDVEPSTHRSVCSRLRKVLREMGLHAPLVRGEADISPPWRTFLSLVNSKYSRIALRGFVRWCDTNGLAPEGASQADLVAFVSHDAETRLSSSTSRIHRSITKAWNLARLDQPKPGCLAEIKAPVRRESYTYPFDWYVPSFKEDVDRLQAAISMVRADPSTGEKPKVRRRFLRYSAASTEGTRRLKKPLRPASVHSRLFSLRQAAAALIAEGVAREDITSLRDLVVPFERVCLILDYFDDRAKESPVQITMVASALLLVARSHVGLPDDQCEAIAAEIKEARGQRRKGMTLKNRARLQKLRDPHRQEKLLRLPNTLMERARSQKGTSLERAKLARGAAIMQVFLACPLRISNVRNLRIGTELVKMAPGSKKFTHILIQGADTKTGEDVAWPISERASQIIGRYVRDFRPALAEDGNPFLFPGVGLKPLSDGGLRTIFMNTVEREVGAVMNPHLIRHNAVHSILDKFPGNFEAASRALQHRSVDTTIWAYSGLETDSTAQLVDEALLNPPRRNRRSSSQRRGGRR
jgi:site-specific recombinase XerD